MRGEERERAGLSEAALRNVPAPRGQQRLSGRPSSSGETPTDTGAACCSPMPRLPAAFGETACGQRQRIPREGASPTGGEREADSPEEPPRKKRKRGRRQPRRAACAEDLAEPDAADTPPRREEGDRGENEENDRLTDREEEARLAAERLDSGRRPDAGALDGERERREEEEEEEEERRQLEERRAQWEEQWKRRKTVGHFYAEERPRFLLLPSSSSSSFSFRHTIIRHHLSLLPVHSYPHLLSSFSPLTPPHPSFFSSPPISFLEGPGPFPLAAAFHAMPAHLPALYAPPLPALLPLHVLF